MSAKNVICVGEAMIELSPISGRDTYRRCFAGDAFNTAWYLRHLMPSSAHVGFMTVVGNDKASDDFVSFATQNGIKTQAIARHRTRTLGLYMIHLDRGERSFSYWRSESAARTLGDDLDRLASTFELNDIIYLTGITVGILSPSARENLFQSLLTAKEMDRKIYFDPNLRSKMWENEKTMREEVERFSRLANLVLPSFEDEATAFGDSSPDETIMRYRSYGAETCVVKNSGRSVLAWDGKANLEVEVKTIHEAIDTTAAGDSFNAGLIAALMLDEPFIAAVSKGISIAARVVMGRGALVNIN